MAKQTTKTYKTENGAQSAATPGTQPLLLESPEQATELGFDPKHVGKWVLITTPEVHPADPNPAEGLEPSLDTEGEPIGEGATPEAPAEGEEQMVEVPNMVKGTRLEQSTVTKPVQVVHDYVRDAVAHNPNVKRKDLMKVLIDMGVAFYTARTQIQIALKKYRGQQGVGSAVQGASAPAPDPVQVEADGTVVVDGTALIPDTGPVAEG